ncbi:MAG: pilus assembly protein PilM [Verrucomicrobiales bacterium]
MSKNPSVAVGFDIGAHALKAVHMARRGNKMALLNYGTRVVSQPITNADQLNLHVKQLLKDVDGLGKPCGVALSGTDHIFRIIEQPDTPPKLLRDGLTLNGARLLNQDCSQFILDCDRTSRQSAVQPAPAAGANAAPPMVNYLVVGVPRTQVEIVVEAFSKNKSTAEILQTAPIALYNAFEYAYSDVALNEAFALLDIGHRESTVIIGCRGEIFLVRSVDFGGKSLTDALAGEGAVDRYTAITLLQQGDIGVVSVLTSSMSGLFRDLSTSIGFFEDRRSESIKRVYVSGGPTGSDVVLQVLSNGIELTCEIWDPFAKCHLSLDKQRQSTYETDLVLLPQAMGAAAALLGFTSKK